jgi:thioredoxin 1
MSVLSVTESNFEKEVTKSNLPVLVDFWAEWCGPCKAIAPVVEELAGEMTGKLKVVKINVDDAQNLAQKFNVMSIPTLLIFKNGKPVDQIVGAVGKDAMLEKINLHIS